MKKYFLALFLLCSSNAMAAVLTEDFEDAFPAWESGWLGTNSNLQNIYGVGAGRGNNPDGLWIDDGDGVYGTDTVEIIFDSLFGATLSTFAIDIATHITGVSLQVFDISGVSIFNSSVTQTSGATQNPGIYDSFFVNSSNGISGFSLFSSGFQIEGNTGIDNVSVTSGAATVPEPATLALLTMGIAGISFSRKKKAA